MTQESGWSDLTAWVVARLILGWKKILFSGAIGLSFATVVAFSLDKQYESRTILICQASKSKGIGLGAGDLSGLLGLAAGSDAPPKLVSSVLGSNELAIYCINKFRLDSVWKMRKDSIIHWEDYCKVWNSHFGSVVDENGNVYVWYRDRSPELTSRVLVAAVEWADSNYTKLKQDYAAKNSEYLLRLLEERKAKLMAAEDSLLTFQKNNKIVEPEAEEQVTQRLSINIQQEMINYQTQMELARITSGENSSQYQKLAAQVGFLKKQASTNNNKIFEGHNGDPRESSGRLDAWLTYERIKRNVIIHGTIAQLLIQQFEQSQIESRKDVPVFTTLDPVRKPTKKVSPPRMAIMFLGLVMGGVIGAGNAVFAQSKKDFWAKLQYYIKKS